MPVCRVALFKEAQALITWHSMNGEADEGEWPDSRPLLSTPLSGTVYVMGSPQGTGAVFGGGGATGDINEGSGRGATDSHASHGALKQKEMRSGAPIGSSPLPPPLHQPAPPPGPPGL